MFFSQFLFGSTWNQCRYFKIMFHLFSILIRSNQSAIHIPPICFGKSSGNSNINYSFQLKKSKIKKLKLIKIKQILKFKKLSHIKMNRSCDYILNKF
ncbi:hypothetical protein BpHYR1_018997 [Brachionus plicatilis]|uniref:Uncharacterized protein n=1 Tax=Brachionus plicatilis TaxID=10195 RepID=A0A3M7RR86_BRAPC|nr:hypothetical protein BpHYR1_018997 [Brachionus plicatilis]